MNRVSWTGFLNVRHFACARQVWWPERKQKRKQNMRNEKAVLFCFVDNDLYTNTPSIFTCMFRKNDQIYGNIPYTECLG